MKTEIAGPGYTSRAQRTFTISGRLLEALHLDGPLLASVLAVCVTGLVVLYSAAGEELGVFFAQAARLGLALGVLVPCSCRHKQFRTGGARHRLQRCVRQ